MLFKDYYEILGVSPTADAAAIKVAYRQLALKWHPDKHPEQDVKSIMQDINEAYAILKNSQSRSKYDNEYVLFKKNKSKEEYNQQTSSWERTNCQQRARKHEETCWQDFHYDYDVKDNDLKEDIRNAREYADRLVDAFFSELKRNSRLAAKGAWNGAKYYIYALLILMTCGFLIRMCIDSSSISV